MKPAALFFLVCIASVQMVAAADQLTHEQALRALNNAVVAVRRAAATRLAEVGRMGDVATLVKALRDRDEETRAAAEGAIWQIWGRSGDAQIARSINVAWN